MSIRTCLVGAVLAGVIVLAGVAQVEAGVLFNSFGPGDAYDPGGSKSATTPSRGSPPSDQDQALGFITPQGPGWRLDSIEIALRRVAGADELDVYLMGDNWVGNKLLGWNPDLLIAPDSGNVLEHIRLSGQVPIIPGGVGSIVTVNSALRPVLDPDTLYWVVLSVPEPNSEIAWLSAPERSPEWRFLGERYSNIYPLWQVVEVHQGAAFRVTGTDLPEPNPIPEPSTLVMFAGLGAMGLVGAWRKRKRAA